jgi:hypothetical protein
MCGISIVNRHQQLKSAEFKFEKKWSTEKIARNEKVVSSLPSESWLLMFTTASIYCLILRFLVTVTRKELGVHGRAL